MRIDEYVTYDGLGLSELVQKKEVKPTELVELAIDQIEQYNPKINAVVHTFLKKRWRPQKRNRPTDLLMVFPF